MKHLVYAAVLGSVLMLGASAQAEPTENTNGVPNTGGINNTAGGQPVTDGAHAIPNPGAHNSAQIGTQERGNGESQPSRTSQ